MYTLAIISAFLLQASPTVALPSAAPARKPPVVWEMDIDKPSLQVNYPADAVRGMNSGRTCRLARVLYSRFGGEPRKNNCSLALETASGTGYWAYCDQQTSYLAQFDLKNCAVQELTEFHNKRLTGTAVMDAGRNLIFFSHLNGTFAYPMGATTPVASFPGMAVYSKHEFFSDKDHLFLLNTTLAEPTLHRVDLNTVKETRVNFGRVTVLDFAGGRLLLRGLKDPQAFGLYDVRTRKVIQRWRSPRNARAHFVGDGWIAFWTKPTKAKAGDWILVNAVSGESVYYGTWRGKKPPSVAWKGRVLYAGQKKILLADKAVPVRSPMRRLVSATRRAG